MNQSEDSSRTLHQQLTDNNKSGLRRYQEMVLGSTSFLYLLKFELVQLFISGFPGAAGLILRKALYPYILGKVGKNVVFGRNVVIRHGEKIVLGDNVVVDDNVTLDAKGEGNAGIEVGANSIVSKNVVLSCKNGDIRIGAGSMIGINVVMHATEGSNVYLGARNLVAAFVYVVGGGNYNSESLEIPFKDQGTYSRGGVTTQDNVWIGSGAQILDGVTIGSGAIVGSGAVVNKSVGSNDIVGGIPAKFIRNRAAEQASSKTSSPNLSVVDSEA